MLCRSLLSFLVVVFVCCKFSVYAESGCKRKNWGEIVRNSGAFLSFSCSGDTPTVSLSRRSSATGCYGAVEDLSKCQNNNNPDMSCFGGISPAGLCRAVLQRLCEDTRCSKREKKAGGWNNTGYTPHCMVKDNVEFGRKWVQVGNLMKVFCSIPVNTETGRRENYFCECPKNPRSNSCAGYEQPLFASE